jgi:DNA polymerase alpha subunit A
MVAAKKKREEELKKRDKIRNGISQYFSAKTTTTAPKAKVRSACNSSPSPSPP